MVVHPQTGTHYCHVISDESPSFADALACHRFAARSLQWLSVISVNQYKTLLLDYNSPLYQDPNIMFVLWHHWPGCIGNKQRRKARLALHYSEMIGPRDKLFKVQRDMYDRFVIDANEFEAVFVHTQWATKFLESSIKNVKFAPVGYEPAVMGIPDFSATKSHKLAFYGTWSSDDDRRPSIFKLLNERLKHHLEIIPIGFGLTRAGFLNSVATVIHIPHATECSFPTMRVWQTISSSATMIIEKTDTWPAIPDRHYVEIPTISEDTVNKAAEIIDSTIERVDLIELAKVAHNELAVYTVEYCHNQFVIPSTVRHD